MIKFQQILRSETSVFVMNGVNIKTQSSEMFTSE